MAKKTSFLHLSLIVALSFVENQLLIIPEFKPFKQLPSPACGHQIKHTNMRIVVVFQSVFHSKKYINDVFYFLKIIFEISTSK